MKTWQNTIGKFKARPSKYIKARRKEDIIKAVREAEMKKLPVRAVGSGHSFSDVAIVPEGGILIDLRRIKDFEIYNRVFVKPSFKEKHLVIVGAGLTIHDLNRKLDKVGLSITNMGGIDHQTISGALSTGTHGSGIGLPAISGMVRSVGLVAKEGKVFRIEPSDGITNPAAYDSATHIELVQDDAVFNSVLVSMGAMGIIYSLVLEVEPMYWLEETKMLCDWEQIKPLLADQSVHTGVRSVMVQVSPYRNPEGRRSCIVVTHRKTAMPEKPLTLNASTRNWLSFLGNNVLVYKFIRWQMNRHPEKNPAKIETSLKSLKDRIYINTGHRVLYQGVEYIKERAYDSEFAFDISQSNYLQAIEELFKCARKFGVDHGLYQSAPLGLRFVRGSAAYLTPEYGRDVCYVDTPFLAKTRGVDKMLEAYGKILLQHGGIPHWGKINSVLDEDISLIREYYPKLAEWQTVRAQFDPSRIFGNGFLDRLGITRKQNS